MNKKEHCEQHKACKSKGYINTVSQIMRQFTVTQSKNLSAKLL